jgi:hypothetical protein
VQISKSESPVTGILVQVGLLKAKSA